MVSKEQSPHNDNNVRIHRGSTGAGADGLLVERNQQRIRTAGKVGTKRFVNPCKVFLGNLPFDASEQDVKKFFQDGLGTTFPIKSINIVHDWKTSKSKGYGFALFTDPMYATSAMEVLNGKLLKGRPIKLSQGKRKEVENQLYIKKKKKQQQAANAEEAAIQEGLDEAEQQQQEQEANDVQQLVEMIQVDDFTDEDDKLLFLDEDDNEDDDDDGFEYDGVFEELYPTTLYEPLSEEEETNLNREQRREAAKRKKRRKLPHKGFELPPPT